MELKMPSRMQSYSDSERRVGVEIEFAGLESSTILELMQKHFGGDVVKKSVFDFDIQQTKLGDFKLELDSSQLKQIAEKVTEEELETGSLMESVAFPLLQKAAQQLVPWEIVSPPIPFSQLAECLPLVDELREAGALGTRHSIHYAFGLHLNPELPDLKVETILSYLRAFVCLYDWIVFKEEIDWARKVTPYIRHFGNDYIDKILEPVYRPDISALITDYLAFNPTRNRSLDMLPLFAFIDEHHVRSVVDDPRINPRPTFHYRLPNCDIDNPKWNLDVGWNAWCEVESLAEDSKRLEKVCAAYVEDRQRLTHGIDKQWAQNVERLINE